MNQTGSPWQEGAEGHRQGPASLPRGPPLLRSLKLHGPRGDVEHGRVEALASEGRAFSVPPLLQHLMDFLRTENREINCSHPARAARSGAGSALPPPEEAPPGLRADPSSRLCPHSAPQADSAPVLPPSEAPPSLWLRGCPFS